MDTREAGSRGGKISRANRTPEQRSEDARHAAHMLHEKKRKAAKKKKDVPSA